MLTSRLRGEAVTVSGRAADAALRVIVQADSLLYADVAWSHVPSPEGHEHDVNVANRMARSLCELVPLTASSVLSTLPLEAAQDLRQTRWCTICESLVPDSFENGIRVPSSGKIAESFHD